MFEQIDIAYVRLQIAVECLPMPLQLVIDTNYFSFRSFQVAASVSKCRFFSCVLAAHVMFEALVSVSSV